MGKAQNDFMVGQPSVVLSRPCNNRAIKGSVRLAYKPAYAAAYTTASLCWPIDQPNRVKEMN